MAFLKCAFLIRLLFLLSLLVLFTSHWLNEVRAEPFIPQDDSQVLEQVPVPQAPLMRELRPLQKNWKQNPHNLGVALRLAKEYRELGRTQGDPRYYGYAQATLSPWWDLPKPPSEVLLLRGILRQAQHDFVGALEDLSEVLTLHPTHAQAWLAQALIFRVQGKYDRAQQSCRRLLGLTSTLVATTCASSVASLNGRARESYDHLKKALQQTPQASLRIRLWARTILAEMASRLGNALTAEHHFTQALALDNQDTYLLEVYSDFLLDAGRPEKVQDLLGNHTKPDGLLLRLALAEQQRNRPTLIDHVNSLRTRFAESRMRGDLPHLGLEARFTLALLNDPQAALTLAQENWQIQREPSDARIFLEAALRSKAFQTAQPVIEWIRSVHLEDVHLQKLLTQFP